MTYKPLCYKWREYRSIAISTVIAFVIMMGFLAALALSEGCGVNWFPKCDDPRHPCPEVQPDYPPPTPFAQSLEAGRRD